MRRLCKSCTPVLCLLASSACPVPAQLRPDTVEAWNSYIQTAQSRALAIANRGSLVPNGTSALREQLRAGRVLPLDATIYSARQPPHATLQDWAGAVFIPNVTLEQVQAVITDYDHYSDRYGPVIRTSRLLGRTDDTQRFRLRYVRKALFEVMAYEIDFESHHCQTSAGQWYSITRSVAAHQVGNFGKPNEFLMSTDNPNAFIWRTVSFVHIEGADGGVYLAQESIVLGHAIPAFWRWIVDPFLDRLARDLVTSWLRQTAAASSAPAVPGRKLPQCAPADSASDDQAKSWYRNQK
jgi:hypothetical protein